MSKAVLNLALNLLPSDPDNPMLDEVILAHLDELLDEEEFFSLPAISLFRWAKACQNLHPLRAKILLERLYTIDNLQTLALLKSLTLNPNDSNSCVIALSGLNKCSIFMNLSDQGSQEIKALKEENDELKKQNQQLTLDLTTFSNQQIAALKQKQAEIELVPDDCGIELDYQIFV